HDPAHVSGVRALVVTSAMPKDHPELRRARECGVPVVGRADALGEVTHGRELVGIAGTHGKTTTTVMTTEALAAAGRDPTALAGGRVAAWSGNLRGGSDRLYVVEADEYDRSFLALTPTVAVVTNIEADHLDIYSGLALGAPAAELARGLAAFGGVERRFERIGEAHGVTILDDYAHHPTEIVATLAAARQAFPARRLIVAFQPHLFSRTRDFARDFAAALATADAVFLTEIYPSRERPIPGVSSSLIADLMPAARGHLAWRGERSDLAPALAASARAGDVVILMGAGDITHTGP